MKIKNGILILLVLFTAVSCVSVNSGPDLITAAERREEIDSMGGPGTLNYWYYEVPGMDKVLIGTETYLDDLSFDIYYPPGFDFHNQLPVLVSAESRSAEHRLSADEKSIRFDRSSFSLGQIMAASGMAVIIYEARDPVYDVEVLLEYLQENSTRLKINLDRTAVWARSRNAFSGLRTASQDNLRRYFTPRALILSSPNFHGPYDIPGDVPVLMTVSYEEGHLALGAKGFLEKAENENKRIGLIENKNSVPDFENHIDSAETRRIIKAYIDFLKTKID